MICGGGGGLPRQTPLAAVEEPNTVAVCHPTDEAAAPAEVVEPLSDAPATAGHTH